MIDLSPLLGPRDLSSTDILSFRVFPRSGAARWMIEATQRRPWHLKTWPRVSSRARAIYRTAWTLGACGLQLPHRLETFALTSDAPYTQLRSQFDRLGIFLGTPGPNRKIVVYAADASRSMFVKIPLGPASVALVSREAEALEIMARDPDLAALVPAATRIAGQLAVENVGSRGVSHSALDLSEVVRIHDLLERRSATTRQLLTLRFEWVVDRKTATVVHDAATRAAFERARATAHAFMDRLPQNLEVPCYMAHGDFTRWNVLRAANGTARIIDWELFGLKPRWFDLVHYVVSYELLVARTSASDVVRKLREVARRIDANAQEAIWWQQVGLYFVYQSLYYTNVYESQIRLHPQALWQLDAWADILGLLMTGTGRLRGDPRGG